MGNHRKDATPTVCFFRESIFLGILSQEKSCLLVTQFGVGLSPNATRLLSASTSTTARRHACFGTVGPAGRLSASEGHVPLRASGRPPPRRLSASSASSLRRHLQPHGRHHVDWMMVGFLLQR
ncbi:hypothetical protein U9M48_025647 [Paspalum notatum var. saurae]|uniref:Uncharacterized protein n=1 Tax=Paspalum notatum var. saurae TaxID=547442 RepID=A0AAQ3TTN0_PASNO